MDEYLGETVEVNVSLGLELGLDTILTLVIWKEVYCIPPSPLVHSRLPTSNKPVSLPELVVVRLN